MMEEAKRWMQHDLEGTPSPSPLGDLFPDESPSPYPTPVSLQFLDLTSVPYSLYPPRITASPETNPNETSQAQTAFMSLIVFFIVTVMVLCMLVFFSCFRSRTTATIPDATVTTTTNAQQLDLVKSMSPEDRKIYVTNFLKTQKFVNIGTLTTNMGYSSSRESSLRIKDTTKDEDLESNLPGMQYPSCAICLDRFQAGEDVCSAQNRRCLHQFHFDCIYPWLLKSQDCPCCRRDYLSVENDILEQSAERIPHNISTSMHSI